MSLRILNRNINLVRRFNTVHIGNKMANTSSQLTLNIVVKKLEEFAPLSLSEKWDNTGILIEPFTPRPITKILLTNDLTEDVLEEAVNLDSELILSYHPPIFSPLKTITQSKWKERIASRCLENRIAVYSPHTSWDNVNGGVNDWLAECLPEHDRRFINDGAIPGTGQGRICLLRNATPINQIVNSLKDHSKLPYVQLALARFHSIDRPIATVALCAGSGASLLIGVKADLFITGEMGHHQVLDAVHSGSSVILTNHSNSERGFLSKFAKRLEIMLEDKVQVFTSVKDKDPLDVV